MVRSRDEALAAAMATESNAVGMCQAVTRGWFLADSAGDRDHDGDADAVDGWLSEPVSARHPGDRNPPVGVPVSFSGGSSGHGHRAIVRAPGGNIRSTDMLNGRWKAGTTGNATIAEIESSMGVHYLGWSETITGVPIPFDPPEPVVKKAHLSHQHTSMYSGATDQQMEQDIERIFARAARRNIDVLTGTEASGERARPMPALLRAAARKHRYDITFGGDCWIAVSREIAFDGFDKTGYVPVLGASEGGFKHTAKGVAWGTFDHREIGKITAAASHWLTRAREPGDENWRENRRMSHAVADLAREKGAGRAIFLYGGDQNMNDRTDDTFRGAPLTSAADETKHYENTGHGPIDVSASYDADKRVKAVSWKVLDDKEFPLHMDHFLCQAVYEVTLR